MVSRIVTKYDDAAQRIFEVVPGLGIWLLLTAPVWLGKTVPNVAADLLVLLTVYWVYKAAEMSIGVLLGYYKYRKALSKDWLKEIDKLDYPRLPNSDQLPTKHRLPHHMIVIPNGLARFEVLESSIESFDKQNYPAELISVVISTEQRLIDKDPAYFTDMHKRLKERFAHWGDRLIITVHPKDLPDEVPGAASNRSWGTKQAVLAVEAQGEKLTDYLVTSPDEDLQFHPQFLAAISYQYLISERRQRKFFQTAAYLFNNNYWEVPVLIRTFAVGVTLPVLSSSAIDPDKRETWSCYTVNLQVMKDVDYWDRKISIDDTPFFWRPYFHYKGDFSCKVFFIPLYADAVYNPNYVQNHRAQYKQLLRWGWGVITFPIAIKGLLTHTEVPWSKKIRKFINLFEVFILWKVIAFLITFGAPIIFAVSSQYNELTVSHWVPSTMSRLLSLALVFLIPSTIVKILLAPPAPENYSKLRVVFYVLIEIPMNLVVLMTFSFLPFIEATTRMMLGEKHGFLITPKISAKKA